MDLDSLAPVTELAAGLVRQSAGRTRTDARPPVPQNPAEVLALLLDFSGGVALAELLQAPAADGPSHPEAAKLARKLQDRVRAQLDALQPRALKRLTSDRDAVLALAPSELLAALERVTGEPGRVPDPKAAARLARELGAPLRSALASCLRQAQSDLASLRSNIASELRALGPRADRLERIDAALQQSIQAKLTQLFDRLALAAELTFERACMYACSTLPEGFGEAELAKWAGHGGWIEHYRERCVRMTHAFCGHLQRSLEGLLLAAIQAEVAV